MYAKIAKSDRIKSETWYNKHIFYTEGLNMFTFTKDCLIGINEIDEEHRRLFEFPKYGTYMNFRKLNIQFLHNMKDNR